MNDLEELKKLERERLMKHLRIIEKIPLTLIVAPIGYGKTTAVQSFLERLENKQYLWVSFGQDEVDEELAWRKICAQFQYVNPVYEEYLKQSPIPKRKQEIDAFCEFVRQIVDGTFYLIIDDYHQCDSENINRIITRLTYKDIPFFHMVLIGRRYPELPFEEMMLKGYCRKISQEAFILSREEMEEIFEKNQMDFTDTQLDQLWNYTDGWISAVYLTMIDYKEHGKLHMSMGIKHLIRTSVYDKLSVEMKTLLMRMSLFHEFSVDAAIYTAQLEERPAKLREQLLKIEFIHYDEMKDIFSMHALLQEVALEACDYEGIDKKELWERNARWREAHKDEEGALTLYIKSENEEQVFRILEKEKSYILLEALPDNLGEFFDKLEISVCMRHPNPYIYYIYMMLEKGDKEKGLCLFQEVKDWCKKNKQGEKEYSLLKSELLLVETIIAFNDLERINECMKEAYQLRDGKRSAIFANKIMTYGAPETLMLYHRKEGDLKKTIEQEKEYAFYYTKLITGMKVGWDVLFYAEYAFTVGNIKGAEHLAMVACEKAKIQKVICYVISAYMILLRIDIYKGNKIGFEQHMKELKMQMNGIARIALVLDYEQVISYVYANIGALDGVSEWVKGFNLEECNNIVRSVHGGCICYGMYLRKVKQWSTLDAVADWMLHPKGKAKHVYVDIYAKIFKAIAARKMNGIEQAREYLLEGIMIARADQIRMPFIENAEDLMEILEDISAQSFYVKELLPYCREYRKGIQVFEKKEESPLTKREWEILCLVKDGFRNQQISQKLHIAPVTVEKNLTNIYRKLQVTNRTAAIKEMEKFFVDQPEESKNKI